jgi:hypothetical protein
VVADGIRVCCLFLGESNEGDWSGKGEVIGTTGAGEAKGLGEVTGGEVAGLG